MSLRVMILLVALVCCSAAEGNIEKVRGLSRNKEVAKKEEAVAMAIAIAADPGRDEAERFRLRRMVPELQINAEHPDQARATIAEWRKSGDRRLVGLAEVAEALVLNAEGKPDEALALLRKQLGSGEKVVRAEAGFQLVQILSVDEKGKPVKGEAMAEVVGLAETAAAELDDPLDAKEALGIAQKAAERSKNTEAYERIQRTFLAEPMLGSLRNNERDDHVNRLGRVLEDSKRFDEARALYEHQLTLSDTDLPRYRTAIVWTWKNQGDIAQALAKCEEVFIPEADPGYFAIEIQKFLIENLKDDPQRQAAATLNWLQAEPHQDAAKRIGEILSDKDAAKVKTITDWYLFGSDGADGKPGTGDDLKDPKLGLKPIEYPGRVAAARSIPTDSGLQARRRIQLLLWAGKPVEAASVTRWWLGFARTSAEAGNVTDLLARCAVAVSGDASQRRAELRYLAFGPDGEDGKPRTADDLKDPLADIPVYAPSGYTGEDQTLLTRLREATAILAGDETVRERNDVFGTMVRVDMLLNRVPQTEEVLPWLRHNPHGVHDMVCMARIAKDGHFAGLPQTFNLLDANGWSEQPDWVKNRRKDWAALYDKTRSGEVHKSWWP
jgi:tetratricopeptide (TPR) repeat protein